MMIILTATAIVIEGTQINSKIQRTDTSNHDADITIADADLKSPNGDPWNKDGSRLADKTKYLQSDRRNRKRQRDEAKNDKKKKTLPG